MIYGVDSNERLGSPQKVGGGPLRESDLTKRPYGKIPLGKKKSASLRSFK